MAAVSVQHFFNFTTSKEQLHGDTKGNSSPVSTDLPNHCNWGTSWTTACQPHTACSLVTSVLPAAQLQPRANFPHWTLNTPVTTSPLLWERQSAPGSGPAETVSWEPYWKHTFLQGSHRLGHDHLNSYPSPSQLPSFLPVNTLFALTSHMQYVHFQHKFLITKPTTSSSFHTTANTPAPGHTRYSCYLHFPPITVTGKTGNSTYFKLLPINRQLISDLGIEEKERTNKQTLREAPFVLLPQAQL